MRLLAALVAFAALSAPLHAHAFCRSTTTLNFNQGDEVRCDTEGLPLYWASRCITMHVNRRASEKAPLATAEDLLSKAFARWSSPSCEPCGATGTPSLVGTTGPATDCGFEFLRDGRTNTNTVVFYDDSWPRGVGQLALTTVSFRITTGEILDADLEVNATEPLSTDGAAGSYDLESIIVHEVGHVLGLAHSPEPTATMRPRYATGEIDLRDLAQDDVCGICAVAPPGRDAPCSPTSATCTPATTPPDAGTPIPTTPETSVGNKADDPGYTCGCRTPGGASTHGWGALVLVVLSRLRSRNARASRSRR